MFPPNALFPFWTFSTVLFTSSMVVGGRRPPLRRGKQPEAQTARAANDNPAQRCSQSSLVLGINENINIDSG